MRYICILTVVCTFFSLPNTATASDNVMRGMCQRLFPQHSKLFKFEKIEVQPNDDYFTIESKGNKIRIKGNNSNSMAVGLNYYLRNYCNTLVSWSINDSIVLPDKLPLINNSITKHAKCGSRFFLNYCTFGYSMPYWKWKDWERMIDWMALNGVTMPLSITGQESIWQIVWKKLGMTDSEIRNYFTGPAQLPWHRMANVDYWQSPLPQSWLENQKELQKNILKREREFCMSPVLPAFAGHVPGELKRLYPNAKISTMSQWGGFDDKYRSHFLDPQDLLYDKIQRLFLEEQTKVYGTDHIYGIDPFNEVDSPDWSETFLANVSKKIYESLSNVDPQARWLQMTWMFYHDKEKWTQPRIRSFLNAVPDNKLILLDYFCDEKEIWRDTQKYYDKPYIWCYLGNFGGNTMLAGNLNDIDTKIRNVFIEGGDNLNGIGATLEGLDVNPVMYEYVFQKVWEPDLSSKQWIDIWAKCRGGNKNSCINQVWQQLSDSIYNKQVACGQAVLINARPVLEGVEGWCTSPNIHYENSTLWNIWEQLLSVDDIRNQYHDYDIVNIGRQVLGNLFSTFREKFAESYKNKNIEQATIWAERMDTLILDEDELLSCNRNFMLGTWINDARSLGKTVQEQNYMEENARGIITIWGQKGTQLNDYANRGWSGLTRDFYRQRWSRFTKAVIASMQTGKEYDAKSFYDEIIDFEYNWTKEIKRYPIDPQGKAVIAGRTLRDKYKSYFDK